MRYAAAALAALLLAGPALAQDAAPDTTPRTSLRKGARSLSFDAPVFGGGASGAFGGWMMVSDRTNLGLTVGLTVSDAEQTQDTLFRGDSRASVELGLQARRYVQAPAEVTPFVSMGVFARASHVTDEYQEVERTSRWFGAGVQAGVGLEWFPVRRVSLAGDTGVRLAVDRGDGELGYDGTDREVEYKAAAFATYSSRLSMQIYF